MVAERAQTEGATDDTYRQQFVKQWRTGWTALPHDVLFRDDLTMGDLKVYMALASFCWGGKRDCHPSRQLLMDMTGLSGKTISVAIAHLEGIGWVRCKRGKNRQDGNSYILTGPLVPAATSPVSPVESCEETTHDHVKELPLTSEETTHDHVKELPIKQTKRETNKGKQREDAASHDAGADAPPAAQNHTPSPPSEKPATTSAPYVIAEALLKAQNRVPTPAACRRLLKPVCEHVTDAYRDHPQKPSTRDALACIAALAADSWIAEDISRLTPKLLGSRFGPWLKMQGRTSSGWEENGHAGSNGAGSGPPWPSMPKGSIHDPETHAGREVFIAHFGKPPWMMSREEAIAAGVLDVYEKRRT